MWLVTWLIPERKATNKTSGGVFTRFRIIARETETPEPADALALELSPLVEEKRPQPSWLPMAASASAKANECSNSVMPVSTATGLPCTAHDIVSAKWLKHRVPNNGQSRDREPRSSSEKSWGLVGTMET